MWTKLEVYNHDSFIGSIYSNATTKRGFIDDVNAEFGEGMWTKYNIGN